MIGDIAIAFAQTSGHQIPMGTEGLYGIGSAKPQEIQQLRMSPAFSLDQFALTEAGITALQGDSNLTYLLAGKSYDMHVFDGLTNSVIYSYIGAKAQNFAQNIPANAPVRNTLSFLALDVQDVNGNSIIDDGENALAISLANTVANAAATIGLG